MSNKKTGIPGKKSMNGLVWDDSGVDNVDNVSKTMNTNLTKPVFSPFKELSCSEAQEVLNEVSKVTYGFKNHAKKPVVFALWCRLVEHVVQNHNDIYNACRFTKGNYTTFAFAVASILDVVASQIHKS